MRARMIAVGPVSWIVSWMVSAAPAGAQLVRPTIAPLATPHCESFDLFPPPSAKPDEMKEKQVTECVTALKSTLIQAELDRAVVAIDMDVTKLTKAELDKAVSDMDKNIRETRLHSQLLRIYLSYAELKKWRKKWDSDIDIGSTHAALQDAFNQLSEALHQRLEDHGLLRTFSAELITGFSFTSLGAQTATTSTQTDFSGVDSQATQPTGFISWETVHFFSDDQTKLVPDLSIGGTIGFRPALTLVTIPGSQPDTTIGPLGMFQPAFAWDSNIAVNFRLGEVAEWSPFLRFGQNILTSSDVLLGNMGQSVIGSPAANVTGRAEGYYDVGIKISLFGESLAVLHIDKSSLTPMFAVTGGIRRDTRFKDRGVLAAFDGPEMRWFYGVAIDTLQVARRGTSDSPITLTLRVDYETAFHRTALAVPSGTRVFIEGQTDIIKAFQGGK
jgi:hypothetical protein